MFDKEMMRQRSKNFDDGSTIEWINKEGLKYTENGYSVYIWVDLSLDSLIAVELSNLPH
jgi:hypothetical protein